MIEFAYYLLKICICSGIFFLYYLIALRNKQFHQWNRFYLLIAVLLSLAVPLLQFTIWHRAAEQPNQAIELLKVVASANSYLDEVTITAHRPSSGAEWLLTGYFIISATLLFVLAVSLVKILYIIKTHAVNFISHVKFINTNVKGTPFSFFHFIFWNKEIDLQSETGQQIFQHELVHVRERHSVDKIFIQIVLIIFWCNPFFWLIRKELRLIHEFTADKKAIAEHGTAALAAMILQSAYPNQFNSITNQFFQTSIKRRLRMLTKIQKPRLNYISRIIALPVIVITILAFTLRTKSPLTSPHLAKVFTVVIDASHGKTNGHYSGAREGNLYEDQIVLSIAQKIKELNSSDKIKIVFTRPTEEITDLRKRVNVAKENNADLFISVHVNANDDSRDSSGIEIFVSNKATADQKQSEYFGSILQKELNTAYYTKPYLKRSQAGVWVLDSNTCPAVLVECGYITNQKDRKFISTEANQTAVAEKILAAIQRYAGSKESSFNTGNTLPTQVNSIDLENKNGVTIIYNDGNKEVLSRQTKGQQPLYVVDGKEFNGNTNSINPENISSINILKGDAAYSKYGKKAANGVIEITMKPHPIIYVDGKIYDGRMDDIDNNIIESVNVLKGEMAVSKYGEKGKDGVVEITTKKSYITKRDTVPQKVYTKTDTEPSIDKQEWRNFLETHLQPLIENAASKGLPPGQYTVLTKFIVDKDGSLNSFKTVKDPGYDLGKKTIEILKDSPKWQPAIVKGRPVRSYHTQPITFMIAEE